MLSHRCSSWSLLYQQHLFREPKLGPSFCPLALGGDPGAHPSICIVLSQCISSARSPPRPGGTRRCTHSTSPSLRDIWGRQSRREAGFHLFHPRRKAEGMGTHRGSFLPLLCPRVSTLDRRDRHGKCSFGSWWETAAPGAGAEPCSQVFSSELIRGGGNCLGWLHA